MEIAASYQLRATGQIMPSTTLYKWAWRTRSGSEPAQQWAWGVAAHKFDQASNSTSVPRVGDSRANGSSVSQRRKVESYDCGLRKSQLGLKWQGPAEMRSLLQLGLEQDTAHRYEGDVVEPPRNAVVWA